MEMNIKANQSPETPAASDETSEQSQSQLLTKTDFEAGIARLEMLETEITQLKLKIELIIEIYKRVVCILVGVGILMTLLKFIEMTLQKFIN